MTYALWAVIVALVWLSCITIALARYYRGQAKQLETAVSRPAAADHTAMLVEALSKAMSNAAEAVGKAVQTAQFAPADPAPPRREQTLEHALDPDIAEGTIDTSDPTDGATWLQRDRVDAVRLEGNEPYGIPGLKVRRP